MSDQLLLIELVLVFGALCVLRVPIAFGLIGTSVILALQIGVDPQLMVAGLYAGMGLFVLLAIPFFLLAGELLNGAGLTRDIVRATESVVGRVRGGLGQVNVVVSMIFAGISGSSTADAAAVGSVMVPAMHESGYSRRFAAALTAAASTMGNIIPPSLYMIVYGSIAGVSIQELFLAGIIPGVLVGLSQMVLVNMHARRHDLDTRTTESAPLTASLVTRCLVAAITGVIVVGGMIVGLFAATEAAAIAVAYCLLLFLVLRAPRKQLWQAGQTTARMYAAILLTIGAASAFGWIVAYLDGPDLIASGVLDLTTNPYVILLMIAAVLLVLGTFMSEIATIVIFTPIFLALQKAGDIDPLQMGVVVVMMLCLGLITPPYGVCLLIVGQISRAGFGEVCKAVVPFIAAFLAIVVAVIFIPDLVLIIPRVFG